MKMQITKIIYKLIFCTKTRYDSKALEIHRNAAMTGFLERRHVFSIKKFLITLPEQIR